MNTVKMITAPVIASERLERTTNALETANHLDDVDTLIHRLEAAIASRKARQYINGLAR